jgi:hypothetical protein
MINYLKKEVWLEAPELLDDDLVIVRKFDEVKIMEETMIDDIREERIYTGHIIKYMGGVGEVVFEKGGYYVKNFETQNAVLGLRQAIEIQKGKIIGNIFENRENSQLPPLKNVSFGD